VALLPHSSVAVTVYRPGSRSGIQKPESNVPSGVAVVSHTSRPPSVMLIFDDVHWGEPTFLDLIEHLADWARDPTGVSLTN